MPLPKPDGEHHKPGEDTTAHSLAWTLLYLAADKPLIVAGGGIINADASGLLVEFAELAGIPVIPTLMGWGLWLTSSHAMLRIPPTGGASTTMSLGTAWRFVSFAA